MFPKLLKNKNFIVLLIILIVIIILEIIIPGFGSFNNKSSKTVSQKTNRNDINLQIYVKDYPQSINSLSSPATITLEVKNIGNVPLSYKNDLESKHYKFAIKQGTTVFPIDIKYGIDNKTGLHHYSTIDYFGTIAPYTTRQITIRTGTWPAFSKNYPNIYLRSILVDAIDMYKNRSNNLDFSIVFEKNLDNNKIYRIAESNKFTVNFNIWDKSGEIIEHR